MDKKENEDIENKDIEDFVTAGPHRGAVKLFICYEGGKGNYIQNPAIYMCPKALVRIGTLS